MRRYEEKTGCNEEKEEDGRRERLIREVCRWCNGSKDDIVNGAEVIHAVLEISHVAEKVFRHLPSGLDGTWWG